MDILGLAKLSLLALDFFLEQVGIDFGKRGIEPDRISDFKIHLFDYPACLGSDFGAIEKVQRAKEWSLCLQRAFLDRFGDDDCLWGLGFCFTLCAFLNL